ncbi:hypothetical protein BHM03_00047703 [Ensete ventricosum]|uniref:Uncharacterized protein n=1 Tax=Ensete ventricosum TaxID=4639 RepID=A0A445MLA8_ENSVE|nr:hypothetical protein BHM03_00047703 [Ensete ventricosum]
MRGRGSRATRRGREEEERELDPPPCPRHAPRPLPPPPCSSLLYSSSDTAPTHRSGGAYKWARLIRSPSLRFLRIRCNNPCGGGGGRILVRVDSLTAVAVSTVPVSFFSSTDGKPRLLTLAVGPVVGTDHEMGPRLVRYASSRKQTPPRPRSAGPALLPLLVAFANVPDGEPRATDRLNGGEQGLAINASLRAKASDARAPHGRRR